MAKWCKMDILEVPKRIFSLLFSMVFKHLLIATWMWAKNTSRRVNNRITTVLLRMQRPPLGQQLDERAATGQIPGYPEPSKKMSGWQNGEGRFGR